MGNPFEQANGSYHVLINGEGQHSLWPAFAETPAGWSVVLEGESRQTCLDYIGSHWTDMRPRSLRQAEAEEEEETAAAVGSGDGRPA